jgi:hypothetical protein
MRNSLTSTGLPVTTSDVGFDASESVAMDPVLSESVREVDLLLDQFRHSLPASSSNTALLGASSTDIFMTSFLEKYSDKLLDIVGEKLLSRVNDKNS